MKKKISFLMVMLLLLTGCGIQSLTIDGKERPIEEVVEILESRLEAENPQYDLEINIYEDSE